jgi:cold shock CspA family protein
VQREGNVKFFLPQRGFGFITEEGGHDIFVHQNKIQGKGTFFFDHD